MEKSKPSVATEYPPGPLPSNNIEQQADKVIMQIKLLISIASFINLFKAKNVLRLRKEQNQIELTFKKVHVTQTAKVAEEFSVKISNVESMKIILKNLGLFIIENMQKHRISFKLDQSRFDIDSYSGDYKYIPEFLEIEAENTSSLHKYAALLGFKAEDCLPWSTNDIVQHYSSKKEKIV